jgi:predicted Ser/Thr protein kinase
MLKHLDFATEEELLHWCRSLKEDAKPVNAGYQGNLYLYEKNGHRFAIKTSVGGWLTRLIRQAMLRNEYKVYCRLTGFEGVGHCYGLLDGRYLVLDWIDGVPLREAQATDHALFFTKLLDLIKSLHQAGVAHGDLKKKDNILVAKGQEPWILDFGVAIIRRPGVAPVNHYLHDLARRFDYNAWVKHKYCGKLDHMLQADKVYYNRTVEERLSHWLKRRYIRFKRLFRGKVHRARVGHGRTTTSHFD